MVDELVFIKIMRCIKAVLSRSKNSKTQILRSRSLLGKVVRNRVFERNLFAICVDIETLDSFSDDFMNDWLRFVFRVFLANHKLFDNNSRLQKPDSDELCNEFVCVERKLNSLRRITHWAEHNGHLKAREGLKSRYMQFVMTIIYLTIQR